MDTEQQDEITLDDTDTEPALADVETIDEETSTKAKLKTLRDKLQVCEQEKMEHLENLQRAKAEFLNSKKRLEEERARDKERAIADQIMKLLPLCDSFHMAMANQAAWEAVDQSWRTGVEGIWNKLQTILTSYGVLELQPVGEPFDPNWHEALSSVPVTDKKQHHLIQSIIQPGYTRTVDGTTELLRPARVTVGEYTEPETI